ncbi:MAG: molybdopterin synthase sulfur carrier subunit [Gammaproteobacteria bacterium]|nr:MAG: molybdopterin synthase sulfur carrier subunit [Gammaproteobacteria bacterium]
MTGKGTMARVRVEYFALLREHTGRGAEEVHTQAATARALFSELDARYGFPRLPSLKLAINDEFRDWDSPVADGDTIVFIPPVAGG